MKIITKFIVKRNTPKVEAKYTYHLGRTKSPMILGLPTNLIRGTRAKGSCTLYKMFKYVSRLVRVLASTKEINRAGTMAIDLVRSTL